MPCKGINIVQKILDLNDTFTPKLAVGGAVSSAIWIRVILVLGNAIKDYLILDYCEGLV